MYVLSNVQTAISINVHISIKRLNASCSTICFSSGVSITEHSKFSRILCSLFILSTGDNVHPLQVLDVKNTNPIASQRNPLFKLSQYIENIFHGFSVYLMKLLKNEVYSLPFEEYGSKSSSKIFKAFIWWSARGGFWKPQFKKSSSTSRVGVIFFCLWWSPPPLCL